jgi:Mycothiol maleylpyruvate isomerase N-terminal domain
VAGPRHVDGRSRLPADPVSARDEFLDRERASWARFEAQVARVPVADRDHPGALERWSVKDLVFHCAHWVDFAAIHAEAADERPFQDPFETQPAEVWDVENARVAATSSAMTWAEVRESLDAARARVRAVVMDRDRLGDDVIAWMADETWAHYDEHAAHVTAFADARPA